MAVDDLTKTPAMVHSQADLIWPNGIEIAFFCFGDQKLMSICTKYKNAEKLQYCLLRMYLCINLILISVHCKYFNPNRTSGTKQNGCESMIGISSMKITKQISEVEEKTVHVILTYLFRSLLSKEVGEGGVAPPPSSPPYFPADPWAFH
jgi:hypothetical protein